MTVEQYAQWSWDALIELSRTDNGSAGFTSYGSAYRAGYGHGHERGQADMAKMPEQRRIKVKVATWASLAYGQDVTVISANGKVVAGKVDGLDEREVIIVGEQHGSPLRVNIDRESLEGGMVRVVLVDDSPVPEVDEIDAYVVDDDDDEGEELVPDPVPPLGEAEQPRKQVPPDSSEHWHIIAHAVMSTRFEGPRLLSWNPEARSYEDATWTFKPEHVLSWEPALAVRKSLALTPEQLPDTAGTRARVYSFMGRSGVEEIPGGAEVYVHGGDAYLVGGAYWWPQPEHLRGLGAYETGERIKCSAVLSWGPALEG